MGPSRQRPAGERQGWELWVACALPRSSDNSWHCSCPAGSHHPAGQVERTSLEPRGGVGRPVLCSDLNTLVNLLEWGLRFRISNKLTDAVGTADPRTTLTIDLSQGCTVCGFQACICGRPAAAVYRGLDGCYLLPVLGEEGGSRGIRSEKKKRLHSANFLGHLCPSAPFKASIPCRASLRLPPPPSPF